MVKAISTRDKTIERRIIEEASGLWSLSYREVSKINPRWQMGAWTAMSLERARERAEELSNWLGGKMPATLLDVGCGMAVLAQACGGETRYIGVEPDGDTASASTRLMRSFDSSGSIIRARGEKLPFADGSIDAVVSFQVLEHMGEPAEALREMARVLKPGGLAYVSAPNYFSFWEGHYSLFWLPGLPKSLAKLYVRLCGRDPSYIDGLRFTTPRYLRRCLAGIDFQVLSWGKELWRKRLASADARLWGATTKLSVLLGLVRSLRLAGIVALLGELMGCYYPIVIVLRKI